MRCSVNNAVIVTESARYFDKCRCLNTDDHPEHQHIFDVFRSIGYRPFADGIYERIPEIIDAPVSPNLIVQMAKQEYPDDTIVFGNPDFDTMVKTLFPST